VFEPEPNLNLRFRFEVQQISEPDRKFEFRVQGKEALNRTEPNFPITRSGPPPEALLFVPPFAHAFQSVNCD
jgi:hypothetical protein